MREPDLSPGPPPRILLLPAALLYALLTVALTWPMAADFQRTIVGGSDAFHHLWGLWWFERALGSPSSLWDCPLVLHPFGADLILDDWPLWPNLFALLGRRVGLSLVGSYNAAIWLAVWANGLSVFLLARSLGRRWLPAFSAGIVFAFAPYFWAHLGGHLSLMHAYPLVLVALCLHKSYETRSRWWAVGVGGSIVLTALSQYYYTVYAVLYVAGHALYGAVSLRITTERLSPVRRGWVVFLLALGALAGVLAVGVVVTGSTRFVLAGVPIRTRSTKPMIAWWLSWGAAYLVGHRVRFVLSRKAVGLPAAELARLFSVMALPLLLLAAMAARAAGLIAAGDFATQRLMLTGIPIGAYPIFALVPNPYHPLWGPVVLRVFGHFPDFWESAIHLGWVAMSVVLAKGTYRRPGWWRFAFTAAFLLSLGPFLKVLPGLDHGPVLPYWLFWYVPFVSAAWVPGRWIVVALLAWALLVAEGLERLGTQRWRMLALAGILFESVAVPLPMTRPEIPPLYSALARDPGPGAVLELPFGLRDGRIFWGFFFEAERLYYQTAHGRPMVGGYLSRIPDRIIEAYRNEPVLRRLVALQNDPAAPPALEGAAFEAWAGRWGIAWVVLERDRASSTLMRALRESLGQPLLEKGHLAAWRLSSGRTQDVDTGDRSP